MARSPEEITFINQTDQEVDNLTNINPGEIHIINWKEQKPPIQQGEEIQTVTIGDYMMLTPMLIHLEGDILMVNKNEIIHTTTIEYKLQKAKSFTLKKGYCKLCKLHRYEKTDHHRTVLHKQLVQKSKEEEYKPIWRDDERRLSLHLTQCEDQKNTASEIRITDDSQHKMEWAVVIENHSQSCINLESVTIGQLAGYSLVTLTDSEASLDGDTITYKIDTKLEGNTRLTKYLVVTLQSAITAAYCHNIELHYTLENGDKFVERPKVRTKKLFGTYKYEKMSESRITGEWFQTDKDTTSKSSISSNFEILELPTEREKDAYIWLVMDRAAKSIMGPPNDIAKICRKIRRVCNQTPSPDNFKERNYHINLLEYYEYILRMEATTAKFVESRIPDDRTKETVLISVSSETMAHLHVNNAEGILMRYYQNGKHKIIYGTVEHIGANTTKVALNKTYGVNPDGIVKIAPTIKTQAFLINQKIIKMFSGSAKRFVFPKTSKTPSIENIPTVHCIQKDLGKDQVRFVEKFVNSRGDCPLLLDGPAGTGKSAVALEIVLQTIVNNGRCLVTCPTNTSVLDWFTKLHRAIKDYHLKAKIVKIVSVSAPVTEDCIRYGCELKDSTNQHAIPDQKELMEANIILTTHQSSIRLVKSTVSGSGEELKEDVLCDVIITDEAAFSTEINTLTPIVSQLNAKKRPIKLVLLGDRNQLTFASKTDVVSKATGTDLMSRLERLPLYQENKNLTHHLTLNYRSRPEICQLSNTIVYKEHPMISTRPEGGKIVAIHVDNDKTLSSSTYSNYSIPDLVTTLDTVRSIRTQNPDAEIMIVCIYRAQQALIQKYLLTEGITNVPVVIAESAQGGSSSNIIISLAAKKNTTWISSRKRMGMIASRAKDNIYLVGDLISCCSTETMTHFLRAAINQGRLSCPQNIKEYIHERLDEPLPEPQPETMEY